MVVDTLISSRFLLLENENIKITFPEIIIAQNSSAKNAIFFDIPGIAEIGTHLYSSPMQKYAYGYIAHDLTLISDNDSFENKVLAVGNHALILHGYFNQLLSLLWFVRDNSISPDYVYIKHRNASPQNGNIIIHGHVSIYNSACEQNEMIFSEMEIMHAYQIGKEIDKICPTNKNIFLNAPTTVADIKNPEKSFVKAEMNYHSYSRLEKALMFLSNARMQQHILPRISAYCSIFECLFSNEKTDINYKISQRVALYVGNDYEERIHLKKLFIDAYNIRSRWVHGNALSTDDMKKKFTENNLRRISKEIDNLLRIVLTKIIFKDYVTFNNDEKLIELFDTLIFQ